MQFLQAKRHFLEFSITNTTWWRCVLLSQPFLIDGFKFDLRLYVLVTSIVPLRVFMFKDGLARFTTQPYREPTTANVGNVFMHLTNYAIQKHSNNFVREDEEAGTKRRITTVNCWLIEHGYDVDKVSYSTITTTSGNSEYLAKCQRFFSSSRNFVRSTLILYILVFPY